MSCSVGRRQGWDPALPWLWPRSAAATLIVTPAWKHLCTTGGALKSKNGRGRVVKLPQTLISMWCILLNWDDNVNNRITRSSRRGTAETNPTRSHEVSGSIPGLAQWVEDLVLLWQWRRPAATAPIRPLAWQPPYATGVALKSKKKKELSAREKGGG